MTRVLDIALDHPLIVLGLLLVAALFLYGVAVQEREKVLEAYRVECVATGFTQAQCDLLVQAKRDAANARDAAAFAVGFSAGSAAGRVNVR